MRGFFIDPAKTGEKGGEIRLERDDANFKHITVLRPRLGESFVFRDGQGRDFICGLSEKDNHSFRFRIINIVPSKGEPPVRITLFQCLPKRDKMAYIIQKTIEVGVSRIIPVISERTEVRPGNGSSGKQIRWQKIAKGAAEQSGRGIVAEIGPVVGVKEAADILASMDEAYIAYEKERHITAKEAFNAAAAGKGKEAGFFIGPEGGFSEGEVMMCADKNIRPFSLGERIMRTETAGFAAILLYLFSREAL